MRGKAALRFLSRYGIVLGLLAICLGLTLASPVFFTRRNLLNVARQISENAIIATGMTFVILTGGIDLSVGSLLALVGVVGAMVLTHEGLLVAWEPGMVMALTFIAGLGVGGGVGALNGLMVAGFRVPPFIATLAMMTICRGLARLLTNGIPVGLPPASDPWFSEKARMLERFSVWGQGYWLAVPVPVWVMGAVMLLAHGILTQTRFGRYVYAIGGNPTAARLSGVKVGMVVFSVYLIVGLLTAISGLIEMSMLQSGAPEAGFLYELNAIAAVVVGGTSLSGGRGSVGGTLVGALLIGVLNNGLNLLGISPFYQDIAKGVVILAAVLFDQWTKKEARP